MPAFPFAVITEILLWPLNGTHTQDFSMDTRDKRPFAGVVVPGKPNYPFLSSELGTLILRRSNPCTMLR